jgi:predicted nucleic acid-binding protein
MPANRRIIIDTGPLVALLNQRDTHHQWAKARFAELTPPRFPTRSRTSE